jgi:ELWxxDGT repeat protein
MRYVLSVFACYMALSTAFAQTPKALFLNNTDVKVNVWITDGTEDGTVAFPITPDSGYAVGSYETPLSANPFLVLQGGRQIFFEEEVDLNTSQSSEQIYVTDGTSAGTTHVTIPFTSFLAASAATSLGSKVLMLDDAHSIEGQPPTLTFLLTDWTNGGTSMFTVPGPPPPLSFGHGPMVTLGNKAMFSGTDYSGLQSLWMSDGTAAGTHPLTVTGVASDGLNPNNLTVLGDKVLFAGADSGEYLGLWVTDGTAAGTTELAAEPATSTRGLSPTNLTVAGNLVFFEGSGLVGAGGGYGLWVTDGTTAGTQQLVVAGTDSQYGPQPVEIVALGNRVLVSGTDASDKNALFISDGTSAGSYEIPWAGNSPENFTVLGNRVLFAATDSAGNQGLWSSDGTAEGTAEITVPNAYYSGVFTAIAFSGPYAPTRMSFYENNFAVIGNRVVFAGTDALDKQGLWITDGTSAGTSEISIAGTPMDLSSSVIGTASPLVAAVLPQS